MDNNKSAESDQSNQIDLRRLGQICRRHARLMIIWTLVLGLVGYVVAEFVITPQYTASTQILVNQKHDKNSDAYNDQQADVQMINTYKDIITNQVILGKASKQLDNPVQVVKPAQKAKYQTGKSGKKTLVKSAQPAEVKRVNNKSYHLTTKQLKKAISIQTQQNSQVFTMNVKTDNAAKSAAIANTVASVFKKQIKSIMSVNNVTIVSRATTPSSPSFPNKKLFALAGAVLGLLISFIYALIKEMTDTTVKDDDFMEELGLTNLKAVSHIHMSNAEAGTQSSKGQRSSHKRRV